MVPLYQSEIAPPAIRGLLVGTHGVVITFGYVSASWIGFGFYFVNAGGAQWRIPLAIQVLWPLALCAGVMFIPESPRWYIMQDRIDEAYRAFAATRVTESSESETDIRDQIQSHARADRARDLHRQVLQGTLYAQDAPPAMHHRLRDAIRRSGHCNSSHQQ